MISPSTGEKIRKPSPGVTNDSIAPSPLVPILEVVRERTGDLDDLLLHPAPQLVSAES